MTLAVEDAYSKKVDIVADVDVGVKSTAIARTQLTA